MQCNIRAMSESAPALANKRIGFIGGGNMAEALVAGLLSSQASSAPQIRVSDLSALRREHLEGSYGVRCYAENAEMAPWAELLVLAVKPQVVPRALSSVKACMAPEATLVSIAAGVTSAHIEAQLPAGTSVRVVRAMPNAPAMVGAGATAIAAGALAGEADMRLAEALFSSVGRCVRVAERLLDAVTGLSGSGPAYVMVMIDALADGGVKMGLPRSVAQELAAQTVLGAARMQLEIGEHPAVLKDRVTSPGGTTIAGLAALERRGFRAALIDAVEAASDRSRALGVR